MAEQFNNHYRSLHRQLALANENLERQVAARTALLCRWVDELQGLSFRDALTGLYNRRHFDTAFNLACHEARSNALRSALADTPMTHQQRPLGNVTFSAGIASYPDIADLGQLMSCADRALYRAKARGCDCSVVFTP